MPNSRGAFHTADAHLYWRDASPTYQLNAGGQGNQGSESGRIVNSNDGETSSDNYSDRGVGRVKSFVGTYKAGYISSDNAGNIMDYYSGHEVRPINVAVRFWRRTV